MKIFRFNPLAAEVNDVHPSVRGRQILLRLFAVILLSLSVIAALAQAPQQVIPS